MSNLLSYVNTPPKVNSHTTLGPGGPALPTYAPTTDGPVSFDMSSPAYSRSVANTVFSSWDTTKDADVGQYDAQIKAYNAMQGTSLYDPKHAAELVQQRQNANAARWQTANLAGSPAADAIKKGLLDGSITTQDLAGFDITALNDPAQLAQVYQSIQDKKKAALTSAPPPGTDPVQAPVDQAAADAQASVGSLLDNVTKQANDALNPNNPDSALGKFDAQANATLGKVSSDATSLAQQGGGALAGSIANNAGTSTQANNAAGHDLTQKDSLAQVNDYVNKALSDDMNMQKDVASMNVDDRLNIQRHTAGALIDELKKNIGVGNAQATAQIQDLQARIDHWQTLAKGSAEQTTEWNKILGIAAGVVMGVAGGALAATPGGQVPGALLASGGVGQIARSV